MWEECNRQSWVSVFVFTKLAFFILRFEYLWMETLSFLFKVCQK